MKNQLNPLFEYLKYLREDTTIDNSIDDNAVDSNDEENNSIIDKYADKVEKTDLVDPVMVASMVTPIPGAAIIGNAYTKAYSKKDRAKAYKEIVKHPFKSLAKAPIKVPEAAIKTAIKLPKATYDFGKDVVDKVSHPKRTYRRTKKSIENGIDNIKKWYKNKREKEVSKE